MSCTEAGYGASLPERKSREIDTKPACAMAWWRSFSVNRSCRHQAPPWHSTSAGNGPSPRGLNTRASNGLSPWRRYSMSSTSKSWVLVSILASNVAVMIATISLHVGFHAILLEDIRACGRGEIFGQCQRAVALAGAGDDARHHQKLESGRIR